ncbi:hypothetical protein [Fangia hongkongensis]|uniref:hypothetical protein n=1 Tax=Fangia hongkongensis TaxID=270495 RepID=UPI000365DF56|nr:hypothetical protein [Fangia hongkongensis]MBK2124342.1 hypothetical protein [Fangia hongkongensis]
MTDLNDVKSRDFNKVEMYNKNEQTGNFCYVVLGDVQRSYNDKKTVSSVMDRLRLGKHAEMHQTLKEAYDSEKFAYNSAIVKLEKVESGTVSEKNISLLHYIPSKYIGDTDLERIATVSTINNSQFEPVKSVSNLISKDQINCFQQEMELSVISQQEINGNRTVTK